MKRLLSIILFVAAVSFLPLAANCADLPTITITGPASVVLERGGNGAEFTIHRTGDTGNPLTVTYSVAGTATNGVDYRRLSGSVVVPAGQSSAAILVVPRKDRVAEGDETVEITLLESASYVVGSPNSGTCTMADSDSPRARGTVLAARAGDPQSGNAGALPFSRTGNRARGPFWRDGADGARANGVNALGLARIPGSGCHPCQRIIRRSHGNASGRDNRSGQRDGQPSRLVRSTASTIEADDSPPPVVNVVATKAECFKIRDHR